MARNGTNTNCHRCWIPRSTALVTIGTRQFRARGELAPASHTHKHRSLHPENCSTNTSLLEPGVGPYELPAGSFRQRTKRSLRRTQSSLKSAPHGTRVAIRGSRLVSTLRWPPIDAFSFSRIFGFHNSVAIILFRYSSRRRRKIHSRRFIRLRVAFRTVIGPEQRLEDDLAVGRAASVEIGRGGRHSLGHKARTTSSSVGLCLSDCHVGRFVRSSIQMSRSGAPGRLLCCSEWRANRLSRRP